MIRIFPKGFSPKVNIIALLEFELSYYDIVVQYISHSISATPHSPARIE